VLGFAHDLDDNHNHSSSSLKTAYSHGTVTDRINGVIEDVSTKDSRNVLEVITAVYPLDGEDVVR
jgi:hypothetical protein